MILKKAVFFGVLASALITQTSFAQDIVVAKNPSGGSKLDHSRVTIASEVSYHDGEKYQSFQQCVDGNCRQLGPAAEYPVSWLSDKAYTQGLVGVTDGVLGAGAAVSAEVGILLLTAPEVGSAIPGAIAATAVAGTILKKTYGVSMSMETTSEELSSGSQKSSIVLSDNNAVLTASKNLETRLNDYGKPPLHTEIANDAKAAWNGTVRAIKPWEPYLEVEGATLMITSGIAFGALAAE